MKKLSTYTLIAMLSGIALVFDVSLTTQFALPKMLILRIGTLALCLIWLVSQRKVLLQPLNRSVLYAIVGFGSWLILSSFTALHGYTALHGLYGWYNGMWNSLNYLLLFYLVASLPIDRLQVLKAYVIVMGIVAIYAVIQAYQIDRYLPIPIFFDGRPSSTIGNPVSMAVCLMLALPFSIYFFLKSNKWLWPFLTMILLTGVIVSQTRGVVLAIIITGFIITVIYGWKYLTGREIFYSIATLLIGLVLTVLLLLNFTNSDTQKRWNPKTMMQDHGVASRIIYAEMAYNMLTDKPIRFITGIGQENFAIVYPLYRTPEAIKVEGADNVPTQVHNGYLNYIVEGGLPLLICYLAFIFSVVKNINRSDRLLGMAFTASIMFSLLQAFTGWTVIPIMVFFYVIMGLAVKND